MHDFMLKCGLKLLPSWLEFFVTTVSLENVTYQPCLKLNSCVVLMYYTVLLGTFNAAETFLPWISFSSQYCLATMAWFSL